MITIIFMPKNSIDHYNKSRDAEKARNARVRELREKSYKDRFKDIIDPALDFYGDFPVQPSVQPNSSYTVEQDIGDAFKLSDAEKKIKEIAKQQWIETERWNKLKMQELKRYFRDSKALKKILTPELERLRLEKYVSLTTRDLANIPIRVEILTAAIAQSIKDDTGHDMPVPIAHKIALDVLYFFGDDDEILDNVLEEEELNYRTNYFDHLEDLNLLKIVGSCQDDLYDGREWSTYKIALNKPVILRRAQKYEKALANETALLEPNIQYAGLESTLMAAST
jgi:hypothetical protein